MTQMIKGRTHGWTLALNALIDGYCPALTPDANKDGVSGGSNFPINGMEALLRLRGRADRKTPFEKLSGDSSIHQTSKKDLQIFSAD